MTCTRDQAVLVTEGKVADRVQEDTSTHLDGEIKEEGANDVETVGEGPSNSEHQDGVDQGPSDGVDEGSSDGVDEGSSDGVDEGPSDGVDEGPSDGVDERPGDGVDDGSSDGVDEGPSDGVDEGPSDGVDDESSDGVDEGPSDGVDEGPSGGVDEGVNEGPSDGVDERPSDGVDEGPSDGVDEGPSDGEDQENDDHEPHPDHIEDNDDDKNTASIFCVCETHYDPSRVETTMAEKEAVSMSDILRLLVETQQRQVEAEQRREEERRQEQRREEGERIRREESERQLELISKLVERTEVRTRRGPSEKDVQLVRLTEKDDIETYLTTFERVMEAYEIDKSRWAFKLAPYLSGKAQQAYASLSAEEAAQYESVKEAVFHRYDIKEETYRQRFRSMRKGPGETYREQASKLNDMAKKWLKGCTTVDELLDVIVKEQLVDTLPQALKVWVSEREPSSSKEAGELADSYLQARGLQRGGAGRGEHGERLSLDREQQWPRREKVEEDRKSKNPGDRGYQRKQEASGRRGLGNARCYNCSKTGHLSWNCPEKALYSHSRGNDITRRQTVLLRSGFVEGNKVEDIVLDTGCSRTMIRRDLVPTTKILDDAVTVQCAHGDTVASLWQWWSSRWMVYP
eukprot:Em0001g3365a